MTATRLANPFGRGKIDLSGKTLSISEKTWLCHEIKYHGQTASELGKKYNLNRKSLTQWVAAYTKNGILGQQRGRPRCFLSRDLEYIKASVSSNIHNTTKADFEAEMQAEHVKKCVKRTGIAECSVTPLSDRTIVRYREDMTLKLGNAEQTTDARAVATADKLNAVSTAAAHFLMMPLTSPHLVINADGTSFQTGGGQTELKAVVYDPEIQKKKGVGLKVLADKSQSLTGYFVKFYLCISATGSSAPPVYILADKNMKEGLIDVHEVMGLGIGTDLASVGWVVFAKTRAVNEEFYRWWFVTVFHKFVVDIRNRYKLGVDLPVYFNLDGEETQIRPLRNPFIVQLCEELNVIIGKTPASTTAITQPCDAGKCFLAAKTKRKNLKKSSVVQDEAMDTQLREVLKEHEVRVAKGKFNASHIKPFITGLQTVQFILSTTMRRDMIIESFAITGQYDPVVGGCNVERILGQCKTKFTAEEITKVWALLPVLCKLFKENGELKEKDFKPLEMYGLDVDEKRCRDTLILNRRRFVFLTSPAVIASEIQKKNDKAALIDDKADKAAKRKAAAAEKKANPQPRKRAKKNQAVVSEIVA